MYSRGGIVRILNKRKGLVFLETDWDLGRLPLDLVEEAGLLGCEFSLLGIHERAKLGGYAKNENKALFSFEISQYPWLQEKKLRVYFASDLNGWKKAIGQEKWELSRNENSCYVLELNWSEIIKVPSFQFKFVTEEGQWLEPSTEFLEVVTESEYGNYVFDAKRSGKDIFSFLIIDPHAGNELDSWINYSPEGTFGYTVEKNEGVFRIFAPRAKKVELLLYKKLIENEFERLPMSRQTDGSWVKVISRNWEGSYYRYSIFKEIPNTAGKSYEKKILDPYAKVTVGRDGPGVVISPAIEDNDENLFSPPHVSELVILESHLRDLLANAPIGLSQVEKLEFRGLTKWLSSSSCYLRQIGVNAVELQPMQEFDSKSKIEYHWGYMPVNFFSPESGYSSDSKKGIAIEEFKALIDAFHAAGISVILDVVYNHVGIPMHLFNLDRELYFRLDEHGKLENFSGCGNDLNCESEPVRKLILDSLEYLIRAFDIDGFRFDLGELIGANFLELIEKRMKKIKPGLILIAEPWSFRGRLQNSMKKTGFTLWSDKCREEVFKFVKGEGNRTAIIDLLKGELNQNENPWQSVNYIESHDDFTFIDRLSGGNEQDKDQVRDETAKASMFAIIIVLLSPGVPMLSAGQDFFRNKKGIRNTYRSGDLNALQYKSSEMFFKYTRRIRELIEFRQSERGSFLRPINRNDCDYSEWTESPDGIIGLFVEERQSGRKLMIVLNSSSQNIQLKLPNCWKNAQCLFPENLFTGQLNSLEFCLLERMD